MIIYSLNCYHQHHESHHQIHSRYSHYFIFIQICVINLQNKIHNVVLESQELATFAFPLKLNLYSPTAISYQILNNAVRTHFTFPIYTKMTIKKTFPFSFFLFFIGVM